MCQDCPLAWSPADTAHVLTIKLPLSVPITGTSPKLLQLLVICDCLRRVWVSSSWFGWNTARLHTDNIPVQTIKVWCPGIVITIARCCTFVPKQGERPVWFSKIPRCCLCIHCYTKQSKSLNGPYLKKLLTCSFNLDRQSVWPFSYSTFITESALKIKANT